MPNGCHNKPERVDRYRVQDGWIDDWYTELAESMGRILSRWPIMIDIPDRGSPGCGHPTRGEDAGCEGCRWR